MNDQDTITEPATTEELKYLYQRVAELEKIAARSKRAEAVEKQQRQLLQRRSAELATMLEVTRAISSSLDLEEILLQVAEHAAGLASAEGCILLRWDRESNTLVTWLEWRRDGRPLDPLCSVYALADFPAIRRVLKSGQHFILRIDDKHAGPAELAFLQQTGLISALLLPLIARKRVIGLLELTYSRREPDFSLDDISLYSALADQAAVAIDKAHLYAENERRLREQTALREAGLVISSTLDQDAVLFHIVQQLVQVLDATSACLCNYNPETATVAILAQYIGPQAGPAEQAPGFAAANAASSGLPGLLNFFTGQADSFRVQHWDDPDLEPSLRRHMQQSGAKTVLVVPLRIGGRVVAYVELWESRQRRQFSVEEIALIQGIAQQAAIAIENARLYRQAQQEINERRQAEQALQRYAGRLAALHDIDRTILTVQSPEEVAQAALSHIQQMIPCCRASVVAFDLKTGSATVLAARLKGEVQWGERLAVSTAEFETGVLKQGQVYRVDDTQVGARLRTVDQKLFEEGVRSFINVPLQAGGELIGSLNLGSDHPHAFDAENLDIAREVASSLALAIHQARLHQQTRQYAATKAALLDEVNHRVKNNLGAIAGILHVERRRAELTGQIQCRDIITDLIARVLGLTTAHNLLSASEWSDLLLTNLARQVINSALQMTPAGKHIHVQLSSSPIRVSPKQANTLALVLNELATNTVKHALGERETGRLIVSIFQENTSICIEFRDDGPGYPSQVLDLEEYNTGLYLVNSLIRQDLAGQINFANNRGAVAIIRFKVSNQPAKER